MLQAVGLGVAVDASPNARLRGHGVSGRWPVRIVLLSTQECASSRILCPHDLDPESSHVLDLSRDRLRLGGRIRSSDLARVFTPDDCQVM